MPLFDQPMSDCVCWNIFGTGEEKWIFLYRTPEVERAGWWWFGCWKDALGSLSVIKNCLTPRVLARLNFEHFLSWEVWKDDCSWSFHIWSKGEHYIDFIFKDPPSVLRKDMEKIWLWKKHYIGGLLEERYGKGMEEDITLIVFSRTPPRFSATLPITMSGSTPPLLAWASQS